MMQVVESVLTKNALLTAFVVVGITMLVSYWASDRLTRGRLHGSAIAILIGLVLACVGGWVTGGTKGIADLPVLSGMGLMGGAMLRDFAIVATAFGVRMEEFLKGGLMGVLSLFVGVVSAFAVGGAVTARALKGGVGGPRGFGEPIDDAALVCDLHFEDGVAQELVEVGFSGLDGDLEVKGDRRGGKLLVACLKHHLQNGLLKV